MPIIATGKSGGGFEPVSEGLHTAICTAVIDLGDQQNERFGNKQRKVRITWEVDDETVVVEGEEKPRIISKEYTLSLSDKATLRRDLESWRGKKFTDDDIYVDGFDLQNILGKPCQITVVHNVSGSGKTYADIAGIVSIPKGMTPPQPVGDLVYFALDSDSDLSMIDTFPQFIQDKIRKSPTYEQLIAAKSAPKDGDFGPMDNDSSDLPF